MGNTSRYLTFLERISSATWQSGPNPSQQDSMTAGGREFAISCVPPALSPSHGLGVRRGYVGFDNGEEIPLDASGRRTTHQPSHAS